MSQTTFIAAPAAPPLGEPTRLFSVPFLILNLSAFCSAVSFSTLLPLISLLVVEQTGGGDVAVGFAISVFAVTAIAARPTIGILGDQKGRRFLVVSGCLLTALTTYGHVWADTYAVILLMRLLIGAFQGAFFVGSAAMVSDLAPEHRRGEALSWFSVSIYGGMAIGPGVGEAARAWGDASTALDGFDVAFVVSGTLMLAATAIGMLLPREESLLIPSPAPTPAPSGQAISSDSRGTAFGARPLPSIAQPTVFEVRSADEPPAPTNVATSGDQGTTVMSRLFYRHAVWPGVILAMGIIIFPALQGFLPKLAAEKDLGDYGTVFFLYGMLVLVLRVLGRKLPDRLGTTKTATVALFGAALGMVIMGTFVTPFGLYAGTVVLALGRITALSGAHGGRSGRRAAQRACASCQHVHNVLRALGGDRRADLGRLGVACRRHRRCLLRVGGVFADRHRAAVDLAARPDLVRQVANTSAKPGPIAQRDAALGQPVPSRIMVAT